MNGGAYSAGYNNYGQIGNGSSASTISTPVALSLSTGVTSIAAGTYHSLAVHNGNVFAWGDNSAGELGNNSFINSNVPIQIDAADLKNIVAVAAGGNSSYALAADGSFWAWGLNTSGQVGLGTTTNYYGTPQHLLAPDGFYYSSFNVDPDGSFIDAILTPGSPVPEPSTWVGGTGVLAVVAWSLRRRWRTVSA